jgi:hypothetical protein
LIIDADIDGNGKIEKADVEAIARVILTTE